MKKAMLIVMLLVVCVGCMAADKPETKTEIVVGQVWKWIFNGAEREILEVGEKYVVFCYAEGTYKSPDVETHEDFLGDHELVKDITVQDAALCGSFGTGNLIIKRPPQAKKKPYLHKNPNNDHWICSKHGDLDKDKTGDDMIIWFSTRVTLSDMTYCYECYWETQVKLTNQYITGVKENE